VSAYDRVDAISRQNDEAAARAANKKVSGMNNDHMQAPCLDEVPYGKPPDNIGPTPSDHIAIPGGVGASCARLSIVAGDTGMT
jgi:hypothetical protein